MGIPGLELFVREYVPKGFEKLDILAEIRDWKTKNGDKTPLILIDIEKLFITTVQICVKSLTLGGRHNLCLENLDKFFKKLIEAGASLVFFLYGTEKHDFRYFARDKEEAYNKDLAELIAIDTGEFHPRNRGDYWFTLSTELKVIAEKYGQFHLTHNDHNQDIAAFALRSENVLAICSRDSDFLLFEAISSVQYWSVGYEHLNFKLVTTKRLNASALHRAVLLSGPQVAMLGAILHFYHHDKVAEQKINAFLEDPACRERDYKWNIVRSRYNTRWSKNLQRIQRMSAFVWKRLSAEAPVTAEEIGRIVECLSGGGRVDHMTRGLMDEFKRYDIENFPAPPEPIIKEVHNCEFINKMLNGLRFDAFSIDFTDFRSLTGIPYVDLIVPTYKRQAGVVLQHKKNESPKCKFAVKLRHETPYEQVDENPIFPEVSVPDLQQFYSSESDDDEDIVRIKWQLLFWTLEIEPEDAAAAAIKCFTEKYLVVVVLAIRHLLKHRIISIRTADAFLFTELKCAIKSTVDDEVEQDDQEHADVGKEKNEETDCNANAINSDIFPAKMNGRTIRNAHLYNIVRKMINDCFQTCGLKAFIEIPLFDGLLFHRTVEQFSTSIELYEESLKQIQSFRVYIQSTP